MAAGLSDLQRAVFAFWAAKGLDAKFRALWDTTKLPSGTTVNDYLVLHDEEAAPGQMMLPYCVAEFSQLRLQSKMSGLADRVYNKRKLVQATLRFNIHAEQKTSQSAKQVVGQLMEEITKVFSGHPTTRARDKPTLTQGSFVEIMLQNESIVRTPLYHYQGILEYTVIADLPEAL